MRVDDAGIGQSVDTPFKSANSDPSDALCLRSQHTICASSTDLCTMRQGQFPLRFASYRHPSLLEVLIERSHKIHTDGIGDFHGALAAFEDAAFGGVLGHKIPQRLPVL